MKELSIEEKAKRYDEAIKRVKNIKTGKCKTTFMFTEGLFEHIFPELAESENERVMRELIDYFGGTLNGEDVELPSKDTMERWVAWLKKQGEQKPNPCENCGIATNNCQKFPCAIRDGEQKPAWSEEDENTIKDIIEDLEYAERKGYVLKNNTFLKEIHWLKSLKDKVIPQTHYSWSEEEIEKAAQEWDSKASFRPFYISPTGVKQDVTTHAESFKAGINWILKSLRPQNTWKPSDEQMQVLVWCKPLFAEPKLKGILESLINDLKKLREEDV